MKFNAIYNLSTFRKKNVYAIELNIYSKIVENNF